MKEAHLDHGLGPQHADEREEEQCLLLALHRSAHLLREEGEVRHVRHAVRERSAAGSRAAPHRPAGSKCASHGKTYALEGRDGRKLLKVPGYDSGANLGARVVPLNS